MNTISKMTPVEIDTILARLYGEEQTVVQYRMRHIASIESDEEELGRIADGTSRSWNKDPKHYQDSIKESKKRIAKLDKELDVIRAEAKPYHDDYATRPWNRYFLVRNAGGHIHRWMTCTSCFPTTVYGWMVDLSDCDEREMVKKHGVTACTVCFPGAPTLPGWQESIDRENSKWCAGSSQYDHKARHRWTNCPVCGLRGVAVSSNGKIRKHEKYVAPATCTGGGKAPSNKVDQYDGSGRCGDCGKQYVSIDRETRLLKEHEAKPANCSGTKKDALNVKTGGYRPYGDCPDCDKKGMELTKKNKVRAHVTKKAKVKV